ncbi:hypothetical protein NDU88_004261 [Pleurodeles waltl]|uniref:Uncharacterized protein n=1 Tax=Pleurodeles waltl TaxID=8319 RepID=A0AAV7V0X3_PLEWA|nr:hypothetical protein NDU88_004261 [Pleurodeles waltl]
MRTNSSVRARVSQRENVSSPNGIRLLPALLQHKNMAQFNDDQYGEYDAGQYDQHMEEHLVEVLDFHVQDSVNKALVKALRLFAKPIFNFGFRRFGVGSGNPTPVEVDITEPARSPDDLLDQTGSPDDAVPGTSQDSVLPQFKRLPSMDLPLHQFVMDVVLREWKDPDRIGLPRFMAKLYPLEDVGEKLPDLAQVDSVWWVYLPTSPSLLRAVHEMPRLPESQPCDNEPGDSEAISLMLTCHPWTNSSVKRPELFWELGLAGIYHIKPAEQVLSREET